MNDNRNHTIGTSIRSCAAAIVWPLLLTCWPGLVSAQAEGIVDQDSGIALQVRFTTSPGVVDITWQVSAATLATGANDFELQYYVGGGQQWQTQWGTAEPTDNGTPAFIGGVPNLFCFRMIATVNAAGAILGSGTSGNNPPCRDEPSAPPDQDGDGVPDIWDAFPSDPNESVDTDNDGIGNNADTDDDNDGLSDEDEIVAGTDPLLPDTDGDSFLDGSDNCPAISNPSQQDTDNDGIGDACDPNNDLETPKLLASDGVINDRFGFAVAVDGASALIGAPYDDSFTGSAYAFTRDSLGRWVEQKLTASDRATGDRFGNAVAIDGDTALIAAHWDDYRCGNCGSVYVFTRDQQGVWSEQQELFAVNDLLSSQYFGQSVALDGDTAVVGVDGDDDFGSSSGAAHVFVRNAQGTWIHQQKLTASDAESLDRLGVSVAVDGDTAVAGAYLEGEGGQQAGAAYVFTRNAQGTWSEQQKLTASDAAAEDFFGFSVAVDTDTALIGAFYDDDQGNRSGSSYIFTRDAQGVWNEHQKLIASDGTASNRFGYAVAMDGDTAVIGADSAPRNFARPGAAYLFKRDMLGNWSEQQILIANDGAHEDLFGHAVAIGSDTVVIGAELDDDNGDRSGSAYAFPLAIVAGQIDDFEDGSLEDWHKGANSQSPPSNVGNGGPTGPIDNFLRTVSSGNGSADSRQVIINNAQWAGSYTNAGVLRVGMNLRNSGSSNLDVRIALKGGSTWFVSTNAFPLAPNSGWQQATFELGESYMTSVEGTATHGAVLTDVDEMRILSATAPNYRGDSIASTLDIDGIEAIGDPDSDGDGVSDSVDAFPDDPTETVDSDSDGTGDNADTDDDNDGIPDIDDPYPIGQFNDTRPDYWAFTFIEKLGGSGITGGCGNGNYCPSDTVSRAQMAVFLERGINGSSFSPPPAVGNVFGDVGVNDFAAAWIEKLSADGVTGGCGGGNYCPNDSVTRAQMAVFLLRAKYGAGYVPPAATGVFADVPMGSFADGWIEQLAAESITGGCGGNNYCPNDNVTRAQMAVFLVRTFEL